MIYMGWKPPGQGPLSTWIWSYNWTLLTLVGFMWSSDWTLVKCWRFDWRQ